MDNSSGVDICRVCRSEGLPERPLFHPCICTGSIKWIHQECLVQWMRYSRKEYCELCSHRFSFTPIYSPDMPRRLPLRDVAGGLLCSIGTALKCWLHYTLVALAWLGLVPLIACRIYRCLFSGSVESIMTLPFDILKTQNILPDIFHGCFVVTCTLLAFLGMVWLREQIVHGGGPDWLEIEQEFLGVQPLHPPEQNAENENIEDQDAVRQPGDVNTNNNHNTLNNVNNNNSSDTINTYFNNGVNDVQGAEISGSIPSTSNYAMNNNLNISNGVSDDNTTNSGATALSEKVNVNMDKKSDASGSKNDEGMHLEKSYSNYSANGGCDKTEFRKNEDFKGESDIADDVNGDSNDYNNVNYEIDYANYGLHGEPLDELRNNSDEVQDENVEVGAGNDVEAHENQVDELPAGMDGNQEQGNAQVDGNWNPIEWDRAVEELTWERLLGLDGSLVFLEHVFWVMALNTFFIIIFAFLPYHFGNLAISSLGLREKTVETHFEGLITTLCGYCILDLCLGILHAMANLLGLRRSKRIFGLCYVIVKVSLLTVVEVGVLPLICGWWLDICSLNVFDATLKDRETSFRLSPGTSMFVHWLVGMVYLYYFASFILLVREVVRPGVLWFLININDPDFSPMQEMIHTPIMHHMRRLLVSSIIFGTAVLLMFWCPVLIIRYLWPKFLPYNVALQIETPMNEFSLELLLFQVVLPTLLEQSHTRIWTKGLIKLWCKCAAWTFGIHSYLLGEETDHNGNRGQAENNDNNQGVFNGLGAVYHQALLPREGPTGVQPYQRPSWFYARLMGLVIAVCISLVITSLTILTLPVWIGRKITSLWMFDAFYFSAATPTSGTGEEASARTHEFFTASSGSYLCWLIARAVTLLSQGRAAILNTERLKQWCLWGMKSLFAFSFLLGIIPLLFGLLLELVVVVPLRVPLDQTPVLFVWQDWVLGVLYTKIACGMILVVGPDWKMRRAIERVYRDGIRNMDLPFILNDLAIPVTAGFSLALAVPYATAHSIVPLFISKVELKNIIARLLYPCLLLAFILAGLIAFQIRKFKKLYEHIKNDKYLVGKRLVNYDHRTTKNSNSS